MNTKPRVYRDAAGWRVGIPRRDDSSGGPNFPASWGGFPSWERAMNSALLWVRSKYHEREFNRLVNEFLR